MLAVSATPWPLLLQETNEEFILQEAGWASRLVWVATKNRAPPSPFEPQTIQPAESQYADHAVMAPFEHE